MTNGVSTQNITISFNTLVKILVVLLLVYFVYQVLDVLALVFVSIILATALHPIVGWMQRNHIPRGLGLVIIYFFIFLVVSLILILMVPPLVGQLGELAARLPYYYGRLLSSLSSLNAENGLRDDVSSSLQQALQALGANLAQAATSVFSTLASIFGGIVSFVVMLVITFYLVVQENGIVRFINAVTPEAYKAYVTQMMQNIQVKLGSWLRGQLLLMFIIGLVTYIGLKIVGMDYALVLALWAGLTEIIPYIGPVLGAIPAVFLALSQSPLQALIVLALYVVVQQLENNIIVPMVMKRTVGLNPIVSIIVVLVGAKLGGVIGAVISIPLATAVAVILSDFFEHHTREELKLKQIPPEPQA